MRRCWWNSLLLLCACAFAAATWGSVDCGQRLGSPGLTPEEAAHLRQLIYFHFALSQLAIVGACVLFYQRHARWKRYYLLVSYNEKGLPLNPPGIRMPAERVYRCSLRELENTELPPTDAPILVYPMMMLSGISSGEKLETALERAYARRGQSPKLYYQPVLGASPWLARSIARQLSTRQKPGSGILVVAHGSTLPDPPPEPKLFCRRLRKLLPHTEIALGYFGQEPRASRILASMESRHVLLLPFLLTEGIHTTRDLPTATEAAASGKTIQRLPVIASLLDRSEYAAEHRRHIAPNAPGTLTPAAGTPETSDPAPASQPHPGNASSAIGPQHPSPSPTHHRPTA